LHEHDHKLVAYCATGERWAVLDLEQLIAEGRGDYRFVVRATDGDPQAGRRRDDAVGRRAGGRSRPYYRACQP